MAHSDHERRAHDGPGTAGEGTSKGHREGSKERIEHEGHVSEARDAKTGDKKKSRKIGTRTRGVETLFRSSYRAHLSLTSLADSKANIMISINGLILSIILAAIAPKIDSNPWLVIPTIIILLGCVSSITFAVLAARPRINPTEHLTLEEAMRNDVNLLFFGNASQLTEKEFVRGLEAVLTDRDAVYRSMIRDIYGMARVLTKKFALLRVSYTAFMIGICVSVLSFIIVFVLQINTAG